MEKEVHPKWINWRQAHREWFQENGIESIFEYLVEFTDPKKISNVEELQTEAETLRDRAKAAGVVDRERTHRELYRCF